METLLNNPTEYLNLGGSSDLMNMATIKLKPKIRIVHIFAPKVIQTDVENFRELVQKLTGKPTEVADVAVGKKRESKKQKIEKEVENGNAASSVEVKRELEEWLSEENCDELFGGWDEISGYLQGFEYDHQGLHELIID